MGINGLLQFVKNAIKNSHIESETGRVAAVDTSCLLHRGLFASSHEVADGKQASAYLPYLLKYIRLLQQYNIHVILVFDGASLPAKKIVNQERSVKRSEARKEAKRYSDVGDKKQAGKILQRATEITWEVVQDVIKKCREIPNVDIIVAPYESDAQLAFLCISGIADFVITEDSDLIVFGVEKIVFKLTTTGECQVYNRSKLVNCLPASLRNNDNQVNFEKFRRICILSGCDYLPDGLPGVGLGRALKFFSTSSNPDLERALRNIPGYLNLKGVKVNEKYVEDFKKAEYTFLHQIVFDPIEKRRRPLVEIQPGTSHSFDSTSFAGELLSPRKSINLATGKCNPKESRNLVSNTTDDFPIAATSRRSIWHSATIDDFCSTVPTIVLQDEKPAFVSAFVTNPTPTINKNSVSRSEMTKASSSDVKRVKPKRPMLTADNILTTNWSKYSIRQIQDYYKKEAKTNPINENLIELYGSQIENGRPNKIPRVLSTTDVDDSKNKFFRAADETSPDAIMPKQRGPSLTVELNE